MAANVDFGLFEAGNPIDSCQLGILLAFAAVDTGSVEERVSDENAFTADMALTTFLTIVVFSICQYFYKLQWAATFAITVAYGTNPNGPLLDIFFRARENPRERRRAIRLCDPATIETGGTP